MIYRVKAKTELELKAEAARLSWLHPASPVIASTAFDQAFVTVLARITRHTPGDTQLGGYWLNGKFKTFTPKQLMAYQNTGYDCE